MKYIVLNVLAATLFFSATVSADNWKALDGFDYYVDLDSKIRQGDLASIRVRFGNDSARWEFDCIKWRFVNNNSQLIPNTLGEDVAKIACKRKWEIWK